MDRITTHAEAAQADESARTLQRELQVASWEEPKARSLPGIGQINQVPVLHRRRDFAAHQPAP